MIMFQNSIDSPHEHPAVPVIMSCFKEFLCRIVIRFLLEVGYPVQPPGYLFARFDIAITRSWIIGSDPESHQVGFLCRLACCLDTLLKKILFDDDMVCGEYEHGLIPLIFSFQIGSTEGYAGCCISSDRFDYQILFR